MSIACTRMGGVATLPAQAAAPETSSFHGKSVKEVAEIIGIAEATVRTRMFYARKKFVDLVAAA